MDNVVVYYKKESGRPPFYTTKQNIQNQEMLHSDIIVDIVPCDEFGHTAKDKPKEKIPVSQPVLELNKDITDDDLIKALLKKGKTVASIASYLNITKAEVYKNVPAKNILSVL